MRQTVSSLAICCGESWANGSKRRRGITCISDFLRISHGSGARGTLECSCIGNGLFSSVESSVSSATRQIDAYCEQSTPAGAQSSLSRSASDTITTDLCSEDRQKARDTFEHHLKGRILRNWLKRRQKLKACLCRLEISSSADCRSG